eukprot:6098609-Amphidinium_carterae.1
MASCFSWHAKVEKCFALVVLRQNCHARLRTSEQRKCKSAIGGILSERFYRKGKTYEVVSSLSIF